MKIGASSRQHSPDSWTEAPLHLALVVLVIRIENEEAFLDMNSKGKERDQDYGEGAGNPGQMRQNAGNHQQCFTKVDRMPNQLIRADDYNAAQSGKDRETAP